MSKLTAEPLDTAGEAVRSLWLRAACELERAEHRKARALLAQAQDLAAGEPELDDWLLCGVAALDLELGESVSADELRSVLLRSRNPVVLRLATYQLARYFELRSEPKKMLFYARASLGHARATGRNEFIARSLNIVGNALVACSYFDEARDCYEDALQLHAEPESIRHLALLQNLGYCRVFEERIESGLGLLYQAVRGLRARGARSFEAAALVDLSFGLLVAERDRLARRHADRAVALATELGPDPATGNRILINALFLQAEAAARNRDEFAARRACARLSQETGEPDLSEYVLHADVLPMVNLRA